jgi:hypothetical protein
LDLAIRQFYNPLPPLSIKEKLSHLHLVQTFSDRESLGKRPFNKDLRDFKTTLASLMNKITSTSPHKLLGLQAHGQMQFLIFITGVFADNASHTYVAEAFFFEASREDPAKRTARRKLDVWGYDISSKELEICKQTLPAMIERCRTWPHKPDCEYSSPAADLTQFCSCGKGIVNPAFEAQPEWAVFSGEVVRGAISLVFPAPFIEDTRQATLTMLTKACAKAQGAGTEGAKVRGAGAKVQAVGTEGACCAHCKAVGKLKKCAKCSNAFYCNKECQRADWKRHKKDCRAGS